MSNNKNDAKDGKLSEKEIEEKVQELRVLILGKGIHEFLDDRNLKNFRTDDAYLLRFLYCTDFNVAGAFKRMQGYYNLVLEYPEWFASTSPLDKRKQIDIKAKVMLHGRDRCGRRIYVGKLGKIVASTTTFQEETQIDEMWLELVMNEPETLAKGVSIIVDMKESSWKLLRWLTPTNLKISSAKVDLYPCKEIIHHVVNTSFLFNAGIKLMWPFLTNKVKNTLKFHFENWPSLHEYIDPAILPPEYGGTGPEIDFEKLNQWLYDNSSEIEKRLRYQRLSKQ